MRYLTLTLSLILGLATSVSAEYEKVMISAEADYYVDFSSAKASDKFGYAWVLFDLFEPNSNGDLSMELYIKINCTAPDKEDGVVSTLKLITYKRSMAKGKSTEFTFKEDKWSTLPFGSPLGSAYYSICEKHFIN